ncbi:unnamed protein product [Parajaminaea phylloscopi]
MDISNAHGLLRSTSTAASSTTQTTVFKQGGELPFKDAYTIPMYNRIKDVQRESVTACCGTLVMSRIPPRNLNKLSPQGGRETLVLFKETKCAANSNGLSGKGPLETAWGLVIVDEAHELEEGNRFNLNKPFQKQFLSRGSIIFRLLLTGTPMLPDLAKQYSLLRSGGNCHTQSDVGEPAPTSSWREAVQAESLIKSTVQSTMSSSSARFSQQWSTRDWRTTRGPQSTRGWQSTNE